MLERLASTHDATQAAAEDKEGRSRCVHSRPGALHRRVLAALGDS